MPNNQNDRLLIVILLLVLSAFHGAVAAEVPVFVPPDACPAERLAGEDLARYLGRLYLADQFVLTDRLPETGRGIVVGCATHAAVRGLLNRPAPSAAESFLVASRRAGPRELGFVVGADPQGVAYGVYALLEKLGCGFYLSEDALPPGRRTPFTFDGWQLADRPLVRDRLVFDWHNFLSGCSTWNLADWNRWTDQSLKMGYNAIMVHAYGNNPMVSFSFNGKTKPVGYLSTTVKGRDWSTMHVNDVRRLWGGEIFNQPVFGADAAQAPEEQRAGAAQRLMRDVFAHAGQRGMEVYFADDVDTVSANPQELIRTLPEAARFAIQTQAVGWMGQDAGKLWLANPDSPEGQRYYQAQVAALLKAYPQITTLVVWFRTGGTPWMELKVAEMPPRWQEEWQAEIARTPEAEKLWHAPQIFAIGKIVRAFDRALKESGHARVQLAAGTWDFKFLAPCHRFFPPRVKLIGLDYNTLHGHPQLGDDESRKIIRDVAAERLVIPVIWAHHDDGNYIGRPYTPLPEFASKLADAKASGFGIIHWTTRPLDLYFKSHVEQVWSATKDRALRATCDAMAARSFGADARGLMGEYLERWVTDAPNFARETTDFFIDRPLTNIAQVVAGCRERLKLTERVDVAKLSPEQRDRVNYFRGQEEFIAAFFQTHEQFQNAQAAFKKGDLATARVALAACQPEPVIKQFMKFSSLGGNTRGEQGLIVSMNTRWLPQIVRLRQQLGLEPVRYNFGPTSHDPLAQLPGRFTFHFDAEHRLWQTLGAQETGATTFVAPQASHELCRSGIESDKPITLTLRPIAGARKDTATMPAGDHRLRLLFADPASSAAGQRVFTVSVAGVLPTVSDHIDIFKETGQASRLLERAYPLTVVSPGVVNVTLTPVQGRALICAAVLEPVATKSNTRKQAAAKARPVGDVFSKPIITALLKDANSYQVRHPVMKGSNRNWERGTWYTGVMAAYQTTGDQAFLDQALRWSEEHQWQPGTERSGGNILTCTQTYLELYFLKTNRTFIEPTIQWLNSGRTNAPSGAQMWYLEGGRRYADSLYVGAPPLAMLARITGDHKYIDWMSAFFWDVHREIFDEAAGLFYRDKRFIGQTTANGRKVLWSRGNGWAFASLPRILAHLPPDDPGRAKFVALFKQMAASIAKRQGADGFWRPNLDDPEQFPMPESSGTGFFCYGLAWGVRNGLLDRDAYLPVVQKAWAALAGCVSPEGRVQWGQLVGDRGVVVKQEDSHEYVTGTFLLAGSEVLRLAQAGIISQPKRAVQPAVPTKSATPGETGGLKS